MAKVQVQVKVNTSLNYRTGPSTSYKSLGTVKNGEKYTSSKQQSGWYYLDEKKGWSSGTYLTVIKNLDTTTTTTSTVSQPVPSNPGQNTVSATQAGTSIGIDGKVLEMLINSVKGKAKKIDASMRLFGQPHQFTKEVDFRPSGGGYDLGRKFMESIVSESPIVYFMPGRPNFLANISDKEREAMKEFFGKIGSDNIENKDALNAILGNKDVRYFDFIADYATYIRYVNLLCRTAAVFMGVGDEVAPVKNGKKYKHFDWSNWHYADSFVTKDSKSDSIFDLSQVKLDIMKSLIGDWQYVQFYVDPRTSFQESSSNSTAESKLANTIQAGSQAMKEAQFFLQTGGMGGTSEFLADAQGSWQDALSRFGTDGVMKRLGDIGSSVVSGANVVFPEIWGNSAYNKSYNVTINLTSPYGDRRSVYLNVIVPLMHLMALALPRQTTANSFTTPFIVKVSSKGWFSCEMGMIDNISIEKVSGSWNVDGLPTEVKVNISIKDLYSTLMMANNAEPMLFFENKGLMNWLAVTCGMDITKPHFEEQWEAMLMTLFHSVIDIPGDIANSIVEGLRNAIDSIWK